MRQQCYTVRAHGDAIRAQNILGDWGIRKGTSCIGGKETSVARRSANQLKLVPLIISIGVSPPSPPHHDLTQSARLNRLNERINNPPTQYI